MELLIENIKIKSCLTYRNKNRSQGRKPLPFCLFRTIFSDGVKIFCNYCSVFNSSLGDSCFFN